MNSILVSALAHVAKIEARVKQQLALIERLKQSGGDTSEATRTLNILQSALEEMRIQIGQLVPTESKPTHRSPGNAVKHRPGRKK